MRAGAVEPVETISASEAENNDETAYSLLVSDSSVAFALMAGVMLDVILCSASVCVSCGTQGDSLRSCVNFRFARALPRR